MLTISWFALSAILLVSALTGAFVALRIAQSEASRNADFAYALGVNVGHGRGLKAAALKADPCRRGLSSC